LLDLAEVVDKRALERAFDQAEILETLDLRSLHDQLNRNPQRQGGKIIRAILAEHYVGQTPTWSQLEERFLSLVRAADIPDPEVNAWVNPGDGEPPLRVDFLWRAQRLIVETDGHASHRTRQAFERDRRRDQRLIAAGYRVIRITWRQLVREPSRLRSTLRSLMTQLPS
jgi:hypothetical protein